MIAIKRNLMDIWRLVDTFLFDILRYCILCNVCLKDYSCIYFQILQELRNRYLEIESLLDTGSRRWLSFDDDSNLEGDKGDDSTAANDSEFDDSEIQSSVTDQDEQYDQLKQFYMLIRNWNDRNLMNSIVFIRIQLLVEQRVELRLREIFEELKKGHKPLLLLREQYLRNQ